MDAAHEARQVDGESGNKMSTGPSTPDIFLGSGCAV